MKVLLATQKPFAAAAVAGIREILEGAGHEVVLLEKYAEAQDLINAVADVDAMIVRSDKVTPAVLEAAGKLKIVVRAGAGFDNIDLVVSKERGVVVENTPGQNSNAVAELAIAMMIYMCRNQFTPVSGCEISGKRLGIQAFGNVGRLVGKKAEALGMSVLAVDPFIPAEKIAEAGATPVASVKELYAGRKVTGIFQPHLYTRTRDFAADFAASLSLLDELILLDIYPAREEPIPGVTSQIIFDAVTIADKRLIRKEELLDVVAAEAGNLEVVLMVGAGNIELLVDPVKQILDKKE